MELIIPDLREYQTDLLGNIVTSLGRSRRIVACMPPGAGKTRLAKHMLGKFTLKPPTERQSGRSIFCVHRRGLVDNASFSFKEEPLLPHGVVMSGANKNHGLPVQVGSIDTMISWWCEDGFYSGDHTFDLIFFDESHSHFSKLKTFLEAHDAKRRELGFDEAIVIGLTATPQGKGMSDIFSEIVMGPQPQWMIDQGYLKSFRYYRATQGKLGLLKKSGDDFTSKSVAEAMKGLSGDLIRDWKKLAEGRATVGFFPRLAHAKEAQEMFLKEGIKCGYVDGQTDDEERRQMFNDLDSGVLDYICNVGVIERGTDIPRIGCVQVCVAIGDIVRWRQIVGRGSRTHPEVKDCIVLDHGGNTLRLGYFEDEVAWTLNWHERASKDHEARPSIECPQCQALYRGGMCRSCGYEPTPKELGQQGLEFDGEELVEVKKREKNDPRKTCEQILVSNLFIAGKKGMNFKQVIAMSYNAARKQGIQFQVPAKFTVAGQEYRTIPRTKKFLQGEKVNRLYPFTTGDYSREANEYQIDG